MHKESISRPYDLRSTPFQFLKTKDGVHIRYGHWMTCAPVCQGTFIILSGRTEFMEKYQETIQNLLDRGFDVFSFDWRGQGLSDRLLSGQGKGYVESYSHYLADLKEIIEKVVALNKRGALILLAHSMGGHLALRYLIEQGCGDASKVVLTAPMLDIRTHPLPSWAARWLCRLMVRVNLNQADVPGTRQNPYQGNFDKNRLTSDPVRFKRMKSLVQANPQLATESVTYGWLSATFESLMLLHSSGAEPTVSIPVLVVTASHDRIVSNAAIGRFVRKLPYHRLTVIKGARHEILQERDSLRNQFLEAFDVFMAEKDLKNWR